MAAQVIITARRPKRSQRLPARGCRGRPPRAVRPMMAPTTATETPSLALQQDRGVGEGQTDEGDVEERAADQQPELAGKEAQIYVAAA